MARQRSTFGSVTRQRQGVYRLRWMQDTPEGRLRMSEMVHGTRREAERRLAEIRTGLSERPALTVGTLWERHEWPHLERQHALGKASTRTLQAYRRRWEADVAPRWADVPCTEVRPRDIQDWLLTMTRSMGELSKAVLSLVLDQAVLLDELQANPCKRRYELGAVTSREKVAYTPGQLDAIWQAVRGTVAEAPFLLCAHAGLRVGEACAVRAADIAPAEGGVLIHVRVQLTQRGEVTGRLKTRDSRRTAVMAEPWASRLLELCGPTYANEQADGTPICQRTVTGCYKRRVTETGAVPYAPMQALRPSYQTNMHWAGVPIEQTSRLLGHTSTSTTLAHYDRPTDEQIAGILARAGERGIGT